ncbi:MAG TPA: aromatic aminobenezylarsenical efflux permease ArsG family transporter [Candidatus Nanoarchaeia archaeon]|nr:aromatic aminobenezylarsenical efflux permease ArsG family transporter [Candidatus Nanoarchaeia archaeon]
MNFMELMSTSEIPIIAAFFIGLMTAISPCPLATNITAIAYISKNLKNNKKVILTGITYTLGRALTYILIASIIVWLGVNIQVIALPLQQYGDKAIGPLLIFIGLVMIDLIKLKLNIKNDKLNKIKESLSNKGLIGSFLLGVIFALAFCPFSAVLYFGMLIPIALSAKDAIITPLSFAIGTGLPVIILSIILAKSVKQLSKTMKRIQTTEKYIRKITAITFIIIGTYYTITNIIL